MAFRRPFFAGLVGVLALSWCPRLSLLAEEDSTGLIPKRASQLACILVWLDGGPPTIDMWDLKRDAIGGGPFRSISTAGNMKICEHSPKIAQLLDKLSIIRSITSHIDI